MGKSSHNHSNLDFLVNEKLENYLSKYLLIEVCSDFDKKGLKSINLSFPSLNFIRIT